MKNTFKVFKYEFVNALKSKATIISLVISFLVVLVASSFPTISSLFKKDDGKDAGQSKIAYCVEYDQQKQVLPNFLMGEKKELGSEDEVEEAVKSGQADMGVYIDKEGFTRIFVENKSLMQEHMVVLSSVKEAFNFIDYQKAGLDYQKAREIDNSEIDYELVTLGVDQEKNYASVYILIFVIYFLVLSNGSQVSTAVAREKNDKTMEILITSTSAKSLIHGKVAAYGLLGVISLVIVLLGSFIGNTINRLVLDLESSAFVFNLDMRVYLVYIVFFVFGYFLYLYLYAGLGAMVAKVEDVNSAIAPVMILFIIGFAIAMYGLINSENILFTISTYIPFFSIFTMFVAVAMSTVSGLHIAISLGLMALGTFLLSKMAIKIYRMGSLNYGNKMSFKAIFKRQ